MLKKIVLDKEIIKEILSKGGITFLFRMGTMALSFLTMSFITNFYGQANFGNYSLALTIIQITTMVFALGTPNAFVALNGNIDNHYESKGLLLRMYKIGVVASLIPMLLFFFGCNFFPIFLFKKAELSDFFKIISISIPFMIIYEITFYYFIAQKKIITYGLFAFLPNVIFLLLLFIFKQYHFKPYFNFLAYVLSIILTTLFGVILIFKDKYIKAEAKISIQGILKKSTPMMVSGIFLFLLNWTDILMLGRLETEANIGIYNAAFKVGSLTLFFVVSMNVVIMPKTSELFNSNNIFEMKKVINRATQIVILLTLPLAVLIILFSKTILSFFGQGFEAGSATLILITLGALFNAMTGNVDQILNMTNHQTIVRNIFFGGFILNFILNLYLIPHYGIEGAAISSLISNIIVNIIFVFIIKKKLGFYTFI